MRVGVEAGNNILQEAKSFVRGVVSFISKDENPDIEVLKARQRARNIINTLARDEGKSSGVVAEGGLIIKYGSSGVEEVTRIG